MQKTFTVISNLVIVDSFIYLSFSETFWCLSLLVCLGFSHNMSSIPNSFQNLFVPDHIIIICVVRPELSVTMHCFGKFHTLLQSQPERYILREMFCIFLYQ